MGGTRIQTGWVARGLELEDRGRTDRCVRALRSLYQGPTVLVSGPGVSVQGPVLVKSGPGALYGGLCVGPQRSLSGSASGALGALPPAYKHCLHVSGAGSLCIAPRMPPIRSAGPPQSESGPMGVGDVPG